MRVKIPREIKLGVWSYALSLVRGLKLKDGVWGDSQHVHYLLRIDKDLPEIERMATLIHEVLHIINEQYKAGLDEDTIGRLESGLTEFMTRNLNIEFDWSEIEEAP